MSQGTTGGTAAVGLSPWAVSSVKPDPRARFEATASAAAIAGSPGAGLKAATHAPPARSAKASANITTHASTIGREAEGGRRRLGSARCMRPSLADPRVVQAATHRAGPHAERPRPRCRAHPESAHPLRGAGPDAAWLAAEALLRRPGRSVRPRPRRTDPGAPAPRPAAGSRRHHEVHDGSLHSTATQRG